MCKLCIYEMNQFSFRSYYLISVHIMQTYYLYMIVSSVYVFVSLVSHNFNGRTFLIAQFRSAIDRQMTLLTLETKCDWKRCSHVMLVGKASGSATVDCRPQKTLPRTVRYFPHYSKPTFTKGQLLICDLINGLH